MSEIGKEKLSIISKLSFAGMSGASEIINYVFLYIIMVFYTDVFGISPGVAGTLLLVARMWDAINDVLVGIIIDRTNSKRGKARPYIFYLAVPTAIFFVLTLTTPDLSYTGKIIWAYVTYIGLGMCITFTIIATLTMLPRMTKNSLEKVSLSAYYSVGTTFFTLLASALWFPLVSMFGGNDTAKGYQVTALVFSVLVIALFYLGYFKCKEVDDLPRESKEKVKSKHTVGEMLRAALSNSQLLLMAVMGLVSGIGGGFFTGSLIYYLTYNLNRPDLVSVFMPIIIIMMVVSSFTTRKLADLFGKKKAMVIMNAIYVIILVIRFISADSSITLLFVLLVFAGFCSGTLNILFIAMLTDTMLYGEDKTGIKLEGVGMAAFTFQTKMGAGISGALLGFMLEKSGYVANVVNQSEATLSVLFNANITFYLISRIICLALLYFYRLNDEELRRIEEKIALNNDRLVS